MAALSYTLRGARKGVGGMQQGTVSVIKATAADTVDVGADYSRVIAASIIGDSRLAPAITAIAGGSIAGTVITLPAGYANDDVDLIVIGPAIAS